MKKLIALLLACVMVLGLAACGSKNETPSTQGTTAATEGETETTAATEAAPAASGSVYYLNFKPEADQAWQDLAKLYTEKTGVEVKVVTAASGTYGDTLTAEMAKTDAPTLFQVSNTLGLADWDDYCMDLSGTAILDQLSTTDFYMYNTDGVLKAIGYCCETFGIITNKALLAEAGYSVDDIKDFASLKAVADDIHARSAELGFDAFSSAGLDSSSSWRFSGHLANLPLFYEFRDDNVLAQPATITGAYLDNFRNIWDLYITDSAADPVTLPTSTGDESRAEFTEGKAVFFQNGTWEYANLIGAGMSADDLTMLPIYCGVEGEEKAGLCTGSENYWVINSKASAEDIQATIDFLVWVVTSDEGTTMMAEQFGQVPFKNAKTPENVFTKDAIKAVNDGKYAVTWAFVHTPNVDNWRATVVTALAAYSADQTDDNWAKVVEAFVDGWAYEYNMQ